MVNAWFGMVQRTGVVSELDGTGIPPQRFFLLFCFMLCTAHITLPLLHQCFPLPLLFSPSRASTKTYLTISEGRQLHVIDPLQVHSVFELLTNENATNFRCDFPSHTPRYKSLPQPLCCSFLNFSAFRCNEGMTAADVMWVTFSEKTFNVGRSGIFRLWCFTCMLCQN